MKNKKVWYGAAAIVIVILVIWFLSGGKKEQKVEFETAKVERQDIHTSITATGTIEPVTSVTVGTQVSGIVAKLYVDYNSIVKKGQVIAELDKTNLISEPVRPLHLLARVFARPRPIWAMPPSPRLSMAWYSPKPLRKARPLLPLSIPQSSSPLPRT